MWLAMYMHGEFEWMNGWMDGWMVIVLYVSAWGMHGAQEEDMHDAWIS